MPRAARRLATLWAVLLLVCPVAFAKDVPFLAGRVNDTAGLVPAEVEERLEQALAGLEADTGAQVVVLTVSSLDGEVLEEYSLAVAETWSLGREEHDDGVLLLIAKDDRKIRLEVGYGLEPVLTDAQCRRIIANVVRPRFREGDFGGGVEQGVEVIGRLIRGEAVELAEVESAGEMARPPLLAILMGMGIFTIVVGTFSLVASFSKEKGAAWFLYLFLMPFYLLFPIGFVGPVAGLVVFCLWVVGFPLVRIWLWRTGGGKAFRKGHPRLASMAMSRRSGSGWSSGGFSSGGGFSGGGGSFGGGGASGSW